MRITRVDAAASSKSAEEQPSAAAERPLGVAWCAVSTSGGHAGRGRQLAMLGMGAMLGARHIGLELA